MRSERRMNPKCQTRPVFDNLGARSADSTVLFSVLITRAASFDHLVGEREQIVGDFESKRLCGPEIDHHLEFGRLQNW